MISSDSTDRDAPGRSADGGRELQAEADLVAAGWQRCFIADEPRLSEALETYRDLGFEVLLTAVPLDDSACTECIRQDPARYRVIYVRKVGAES